MQMFITAGSDFNNCSIDIHENNHSIEVGSVFQLDQSLNYIITTIPDFESYNTTFAFEFYTNGTEYPWFERTYY